MPTQDVTEGIPLPTTTADEGLRNQKDLSDNNGHGSVPYLLAWSNLMFTPNGFQTNLRQLKTI